MKLLSRYILIAVMAQGFYTVGAQKAKARAVGQDYEKLSYIKTSQVLLEVVENGYKNKEVLEQLANSFYFNSNMQEASRWYGELFQLTEDVDPELYFRYALALKGVEDYAASDKWMQKFNTVSPSDQRSKAFLSRPDYKSVIDAKANELIEVRNLDLNTAFSDFGATESNGNIVFASSRGDGEIYAWNDQPYLDLYTAHRYADGAFSEPVPFQDDINTKFHESSAAFTQDETLMFFTRNNYYKGRKGKDKDGTNRLQLFRAKKNAEGQWEDIAPVHFNSDAHSVSHPAISLDGTRLYFASDMEGSIGQSDIYVVDIKKDGTLGTPRNLGSSINTEGRETFPFVNTSGDLYYSTDGLPGLGGLDIYVSKALDQKVATSSAGQFVVENVAAPINSSADDFAFYENLVTEQGYFSSNRPGGKGDDDIYSFQLLDCRQLVNGVVVDKNTRDIIPRANVTLYDSEGNELERLVADGSARFAFDLDCDKEYIVRASKEGYSTDEKRFTAPNDNTPLELDLALERDAIALEPCDDLAKVLDIPMIYFDLDKYEITYIAEIELQKVLAVLNQYPSMTIDIRSHTDCRATRAYNEVLSTNRANATRQYLIDKGVPADRLTAKGYGESQLVNSCACEPTNNSSCTEFEHQKNRRSEFIITSFKGETCED